MDKKKKKILLLSDHALSTSGVGVQSRHLMQGMIDKGEWSFRQLGAAIKHSNYDVTALNEDFIVKPIDGFGDPNLLRITLATEKPDVVMLFTDPRFFIWLFEMEDEIHQFCPIAWWHVWDNDPMPDFNSVLYEATDLINCHSYKTYEMIEPVFPEKTNFIPHSLPGEIFHPLPKAETSTHKKNLLGVEREDHFVVLWINRNARRKRPNDLLQSWKLFLDNLEDKFGHRKASLLLHTDPSDQEGPNLLATVDYLGIRENIIFSTERIEFEQINILHNISDACVNISYAEGFGLATLESMQCAKPIIALKTGGLTRQVVDHRDGSENGVALPIEFRTLVGSQQVPYIHEDYCSNETTAAAFMKLYEAGPEGREELGQKAYEYVNSEFLHQNTVDRWHHTLKDMLENWKENYRSWDCVEI